MRTVAWLCCLFLALPCFATTWRNGKTYDFPIYTNYPPGRQITSGQLPATTPPRTPAETQSMIEVPPGFEARLFASEPEVVNPVAMTWDERGRLWVLELYEYPKGAAAGAKGRDRVKILEDTDADGTADKVTVFADGFSLATGLTLGNGGVYLGAAPNLYFLQDTDGDDKADKTTILKTGFGMEDRHEMLNGFNWGPDGWLYMTHGVFTHSKVRDPDAPDDQGVRMDAALARYHPATKKFEVFADGTSNPWGVDWNERGDAFVSACVIHHLFHMAPGGLYNRQGGTWANSYGYVNDLPTRGLPAIVDWRHHRAAHAGICIYQGDQYPREWRGLVYIGNIHQSALNCDRLTPVGATFKAERESTLLGPAGETLHKKSGESIKRGEEWKHLGPGNFLVCQDPWFRPVSVQTGPDGALWVMDWYDRYPCYQNAQADPNGVDREYGRIWRVVWVGDEPGKPVPSRPDRNMDLSKLPPTQLALLLAGETSGLNQPFPTSHWLRKQAERLLAASLKNEGEAERGSIAKQLENWALADQRLSIVPNISTRFAALRVLFQAGSLSDALLDRCARDREPVLRVWAARFTGERSNADAEGLQRLKMLAQDPDETVRAAVAVALRQFTSGSLTVDTQPPASINTRELTPVVTELLERASVPGDFYYPHIVWMAMEPRVAEDPEAFFPLIAANDNTASAYSAHRVMRRISDISDAAARQKHLNAALEWLGDLAAKPQLASAALDGLIEAQKSKGAPPTVNLEPIFAKLMANPALADKARRLATMLGDTSATKSLIAKINDPKAGREERLKGIQAAGEAKTGAARDELLKLLHNEKNASLQIEAVRALNNFGGDDIAYEMVDAWKNLGTPSRRAAAEALVTRTKWARALLAGVDKQTVSPQDISATARRALARSPDTTIADHANRVLGRYRESDQDKLKLIAEKKKIVLSGKPDVEKGHEVAKKICFVCHKMYGEGADVGPDLTGVGRSSIDALLHNIIDPNEVIGAGYENTEVELKDGQTINGRIVENTDTRLKLIASGPTEHVIARSDIAVEDGRPKIRTSELSLMPEGLEQMPNEDFRNLVWYILNPPQDNRPWTPALRQELLGEEPKKAAQTDFAPVDRESVALWNPDWKVVCPDFEGAPAKLSEYAGRQNVLMTHPIDRETPCRLERTIQIPVAGKSILSFYAAAHEKGDWELRVVADGRLLHKQVIDHEGTRWKKVNVDLAPFAGKEVTLRLENAPNNWSWEFGYWSNLQIETFKQTARAE